MTNPLPVDGVSQKPLLPCPYCGSKAYLRDDKRPIFIECDECGAVIEGEDGSFEQAVATWNRRSPAIPPAAGGVSEAMVKTATDEYRGHLLSGSSREVAMRAALEAALALSPAAQEKAGPAALVKALCKWHEELLVAASNREFLDATQLGVETTLVLDAAIEIDRLAYHAHPSSPSISAGHDDGLEAAAIDVLAERKRQVEAEGWTAEHDDQHDKGEMAVAACCYAFTAVKSPHYLGHIWPWSSAWWRPTDKRRNLVKAGALILAEIERLDRASLTPAKE